jgi:SPP1 gp7 family putative phage head morphogenesis protein
MAKFREVEDKPPLMFSDKWLRGLASSPSDIHHPQLKNSIVSVDKEVRKIYKKSAELPIEHVVDGVREKLRRHGKDAYMAGKLYASSFIPLSKTAGLINWNYTQDIDKIVNNLGYKPNKWLRDQVHDAIRFGEGPPVQAISHKMGYDQAKEVARTAMMNIYTKSALLKFEENGITHVKRLEFNDKKTCPICKALNGKEYLISDIIDLEQPLTSDSHPACRGTFLAVIDESTFTPSGDKVPETINVRINNNMAIDVPTGLRPIINVLLKSEESLPDIFFDKELKSAHLYKDNKIIINPKSTKDEDPREIVHEIIARRKWPELEKKFISDYMPELETGFARAEKSFDNPEELFIENYKAWKLKQMDDDLFTNMWMFENAL